MADVDARPVRRSGAVVAGHVCAAVIVVAGVAAALVRPLAPDLGPIPDPGRWFEPAFLDSVTAYRTPLYAGALLTLVVRVAVPLLVAFTRPGRRMVERIVRRVGSRRPALAAAGVVVTVVVAVDVVLLPLAFWAGYVHEGAWGFRTQGLPGWAYDWLAARLPLWVGAAVASAGAWAVVARLPRTWPPVLALAGAGLTAALVSVAPVLLEPLRFDHAPLEAGEVRDAVQAVVDTSGAEIDEILVADASRRTTKHNGYVSGLGPTRRIVLYDTLIAGQSPHEVAMVMAHELGHHRHRDVLRGTLSAAAGTVVVVYLLSALVVHRVRTGRQRGPADPRAAAAVLAAVVVLSTVTMPLQNAVSRRAEAAADLAALELTGDPGTYLSKSESIARANLSDPVPPRWVYLLWSTHPPAAARLEMGERWPDLQQRTIPPQ